MCQTSLRFKTNHLELDEAQATLRLKRWVYAGHEIQFGAWNIRNQHKGIAARFLIVGQDEGLLDGLVIAIR